MPYMQPQAYAYLPPGSCFLRLYLSLLIKAYEDFIERNEDFMKLNRDLNTT